jgi:hypothetical protein
MWLHETLFVEDTEVHNEFLDAWNMEVAYRGYSRGDTIPLPLTAKMMC